MPHDAIKFPMQNMQTGDLDRDLSHINCESDFKHSSIKLSSLPTSLHSNPSPLGFSALNLVVCTQDLFCGSLHVFQPDHKQEIHVSHDEGTSHDSGSKGVTKKP